MIQDPKRAIRLLHPKVRPLHPQVRLLAEYLSFPRAIHRAPLSRLQRARCYWTYSGGSPPTPLRPGTGPGNTERPA